MVYVQTKIKQRKSDAQHSLGFWDTYRSSNLGQTTRPIDDQKIEGRTGRIVNFAVPADHRVKLKESEKKDKYQDIAWELKNFGISKWR